MATTDVLSLTEAKAILGIPSTTTDRDDRVASLVSTVSQYLDGDNLCGPMVQRTVPAELHNGGGSFLRLRNRPVASVTSITEYSGTTATALTEETIGTTPSNAYLLDPDRGWVYRRNGGSDTRFASGRRNVTVTYTAGRFENTAAVDALVKEAAGIILDQVWTAAGMGSDTFGESDLPRGFVMPNRAKDLLAKGGYLLVQPVMA